MKFLIRHWSFGIIEANIKNGRVVFSLIYDFIMQVVLISYFNVLLVSWSAPRAIRGWISWRLLYRRGYGWVLISVMHIRYFFFLLLIFCSIFSFWEDFVCTDNYMFFFLLSSQKILILFNLERARICQLYIWKVAQLFLWDSLFSMLEKLVHQMNWHFLWL